MTGKLGLAVLRRGREMVADPVRMFVSLLPKMHASTCTPRDGLGCLTWLLEGYSDGISDEQGFSIGRAHRFRVPLACHGSGLPLVRDACFSISDAKYNASRISRS